MGDTVNGSSVTVGSRNRNNRLQLISLVRAEQRVTEVPQPGSSLSNNIVCLDRPFSSP